MTNAKELIRFLSENNFEINNINSNNPTIRINEETIVFDILNNKYNIIGITPEHSRILDLTKLENHSVVILLIKLFKKGYSHSVITLEKTWQLGHEDSGSLDVMLTNPIDQSIYMFEVKTYDEIKQYTKIENEKKLKQVFSYACQEKNTKRISFYSYDFNNKRDCFYNAQIDEILLEALNVDDLFERWNKIWDKTDYITNNSGLFSFKNNVKRYEDLENINADDTKILFNQFSTILRLHSISDKPNAFMKMINLFLAKIADEITNNIKFKVKDANGLIHDFDGLKFQFINGIDTPESFMKRLNELYKIGMHEYLNKEVIDYNDDEIESLINNKDDTELYRIFDNLRLKKNNNFSFMEVYDDTTFYENFEIVKDVVELLENFKFKYETKHQFLGDFFEELLNTSLKQEAGQFFTPYPIVDFMIQSLPYEKFINEAIEKRNINFIPKVIDYACGAGHFLISSMSYTQEIINGIDPNNISLTNDQKKRLKSYQENPYGWVNKSNVIGIEKDYRLAKTTKIATFLNGDGDAEIISGDGVNKFNSKDYVNTELFSHTKKCEKFDFLISNPPYSIEGFIRNFIKNGIDPKSGDFTLLKEISYKDTAIEKYFVERMEQLLVKNGVAAIVLPQSILSSSKYEDMRKFMFSNFEIKGMLLSADITFYGTSTSPVVLFLKKHKVKTLDYDVLIICSPKYLEPTGNKMKEKEVSFLGYEFSSNRSKPGTDIKPTSILQTIIPIMKKTMKDEYYDVPKDLSSFVFKKKLTDILLNVTLDYCGDIYPKYNKIEGKPLSTYCKINDRIEEDFDTCPTKYLEIGDLTNPSSATKKKSTKRFCKKGDILIASLCPKKEQIIISDGEYMLSTAIHVLSDFENDEIRDKVFEKLREKEIISLMNTMLDGFKITYAKISDSNLYNNILLKIE